MSHTKIEIPTADGIDMQDIRLIAGEGKLTEKTVQQALAVIRKQRLENKVDKDRMFRTDDIKIERHRINEGREEDVEIE